MRKTEESCEVCGRDTEDLYTRIIDGAIMHVCDECKEYGDEPPSQRKNFILTKEKANKVRPFLGFDPNKNKPTNPSMSMPRPRGPSKKTDSINDYSIVADYASVLIKLRAQEGLSVDKFAEMLNIKRNYYARIEKKEVAIPITLARRIEARYKVKLVIKESGEQESEDFEEYKKGQKHTPSSASSEGVIYFRKRGKAPEYDQDLTNHGRL